MKLSPEAERYLSDRGVLEATAKEHQVEVVPFPSTEQQQKWLGQNGYSFDAAVVFPNLTLDADGSIYPHNYYVRCFPAVIRADRSSTKFLATLGIEYRPYVLPPVWKAAHDISAPLCIVEKQTAALLFWQVGLNAIALDGTFGVAAKRVENVPVALHNTLTKFDWVNRPVFLFFDSDFLANQNVLQGLVRTYVLLSCASAAVRLVQWEGCFKGIDDYVSAKALLNIAKQREELDTLLAAVSALSAKAAAERWITPQLRTLFDREVVAIQPGIGQRSLLAECIYEALGTTKADLKKAWGVSIKEETPAVPDSIVEETEPCDYPVTPLEVAEKILAALKRCVITSDPNYWALVTWIVLVNLKENVSLLPILRVSIPLNPCG